MKKSKNIIIRNLSTEQIKEIEFIKEVTQEKTTSKALFKMIELYKELLADRDDLASRLQTVQNNILELIA